MFELVRQVPGPVFLLLFAVLAAIGTYLAGPVFLLFLAALAAIGIYLARLWSDRDGSCGNPEDGMALPAFFRIDAEHLAAVNQVLREDFSKGSDAGGYGGGFEGGGSDNESGGSEGGGSDGEDGGCGGCGD